MESAWLLEQLEHCRARRQVLILDCCFSGSFAHTKGEQKVDLERRLVGAGRGRAVLTASRAGEYSTVEDAYSYAADQVQARGGTQSPQRWLYGGEGDIVLARNPRGATPAALPESLQLSLDSPYPNIRQAAVATLGSWLTDTDPGRVLAAQQALHLVAAHDSPAVAAARDLLRQATPSSFGRAEDYSFHPHRSTRQSPAPVARPAVPQRAVTIIKASQKWIFKGVFDVAFSPDGHLLISASHDGIVRLWGSEL